ncbi:metal ABC transporter ATP-binding protein [Neoactinobaculum massilliense]|uniref:metal ABC transporter ATP-binding protein n=1 Tax=Neoactinobaculum massilliense TaxID=2364794 RepID=UPI000F543B95|nr:metal ABC transporter ATP-binding protein [Neoactinobaculum massilliense]
MQVVQPVLEAENLGVRMGGTEILRDISLSVQPGETVGIFGANGSGKSTLVKALTGVYPYTGHARLFGAEVSRPRTVAWSRLGYVPQQMAHGGSMPASALEVVRSGLISGGHPFGAYGHAAKRKALAALDAVGLRHRAKDPVAVFSGGQQHRVLIARALVRHPDLLILDEPLAGIDRESREALASALHAAKQEGITLIMVLHEIEELEHLIDRNIHIEDGRKVADGAFREGTHEIDHVMRRIAGTNATPPASGAAITPPASKTADVTATPPTSGTTNTTATPQSAYVTGVVQGGTPNRAEENND